MAGFPDAFMAELLSKSDIVSVVGEYVTLKPKGRRMWGLCPFHGEKTASFSVSMDKQLFYCFGCHMGGSVVQFIMEIEKLSYLDAIKHLARRANIELPGEVDDSALQKERAMKERLYNICQSAARFYHEKLSGEDGKKAREYLSGRGLDKKTVRRFGIGWSGGEWDDLTKAMLAQGYSEGDLIGAGLSNKKGERVYDVFRQRVIFPIISAQNRVIGFGARACDGSQPKYLNTGETPIFNKRSNLFALNLFKGKRFEDAVIVEGYMDVISLNRHGVENSVATLGTALTVQQARLLKRYVPTAFIAFDGDAAGQAAMLKGLDLLAKEGLSVRVIVFPGGQDPDDFIRTSGIEGFEELKQSALSLNEFKLRCVKARYNLERAEDSEAYAIEACALISGFSPVERERFYAKLALETNLPIEALKAQTQQALTAPKTNRLANYRHTRNKKPEQFSLSRLKAEQGLLCAMAANKDVAQEIARLGLPFKHKAYLAFAKALLEQRENDAALVLSNLNEDDAHDCAEALLRESIEPQNAREQMLGYLSSLRQEELDEQIQELEAELKGDISREDRVRIYNQIASLRQELCGEQ